MDRAFAALLRFLRTTPGRRQARPIDVNVLSPVGDHILRTILRWRRAAGDSAGPSGPHVEAGRGHEMFPKVSLALWDLPNHAYKAPSQGPLRARLFPAVTGPRIIPGAGCLYNPAADRGGNQLDALVCARALADCTTGSGLLLLGEDGWAYLGTPAPAGFDPAAANARIRAGR
ncbi:protein of unknown function [Candidatus Hydrogenisulfobacillus filiaventi]|uniref:Uncharacterized protein n=1 Tax=Candidatus Hydrogenisulfobacillus filiaventi TaxID=2707344 RepID=A0A6F8ZIW1_9FIRM|nr:protein of unknown function [Candidatus Hydrogenisulfobacillus filiaventi]